MLGHTVRHREIPMAIQYVIEKLELAFAGPVPIFSFVSQAGGKWGNLLYYNVLAFD